MRVLVVTSGWPDAEHPERSVFVAQEVDFLRRRGIDVEVIAYRGMFDPTNYVRARRAVHEEINRRCYDVVHGHFGQTATAILGTGRPTAITFHGSDLLGVIGRRGRNTARGFVLRRVSRFAARRVDQVIVAGRRLISELPHGVAYEIVPAGVDGTIFNPGPRDAARAELGLAPHQTLVLFSGSPTVARKRHDLALKAMEAFDPSGRARLVTVAGLPRSEVARYMRASDVLIVTAKHESGPLMVKEALACDLPVVSVDVGDVRERVSGLQRCFICEDAPQALADGLRRSLLDPTPFDGRDAVRDVMQEALTDRLAAIYERIAQRGR